MNQLFLLAATGGLFGTLSIKAFLWCFFYAWLGHFILLNIDVMTRDPQKAGTPTGFHLQTYITNNWKRSVLTLLLIFIAIRFYDEFYHTPISDFKALAVGLALDGFVLLLKKYSKLKGKI